MNSLISDVNTRPHQVEVWILGHGAAPEQLLQV